MKKIKVLFIANCVPMGGGNQSLLQLMKELSRPPYNVEPILLTTFDLDRYSSSIVKEARAIGIECLTERFYPFKWESSKSPINFIKYASNCLNYPRILHKIRKIKPDLIHSNSSIIDIGSFLSSKLKLKHIWHLREFGDRDFNLKPLFGKIQERMLYKGDHRFIAVSKAIKERYLPYIFPESKIEIIYNGLPLKPNDGQRSPKIDDNIVKFCMSGTLNEAKRHIDALEAMDILVNRRNIKNVRLYIIGDGPLMDRLKRLCNEKGLTDNVCFTGWTNRVSDFYSLSDVGLMLSTNEAFGRVTVEYMRSGLATIASDGGANKEIIENHKTGLLFPTGDTEALCDIMELMIVDSSLRKRIAKAGHDFSMSHFLSDHNTKAIYDVYTELLD